MIDSGSIIFMPVPGRMRTAKLLPVELTVTHTVCHFLRQIDGRNIIMISYALVAHNYLGLHAFVK